MLDYESSDPDEVYLTHLCDVSTYAINDRELRLYYSKDEYFKFRLLESATYDESLLPGCWDEIPNESWGNYGLYLKFYRK